MDEPDKQDQGKDSFIDKMKEKARLNRGVNFLWDHSEEIFSGILVFIGLVLSFFYIHLGGTLVGLGFGICFNAELRNYFLRVKEYYTEKGLPKTLVLAAVLLYSLISIPAFVIATAIGFGVMFLIRWIIKK